MQNHKQLTFQPTNFRKKWMFLGSGLILAGLVGSAFIHYKNKKKSALPKQSIVTIYLDKIHTHHSKQLLKDQNTLFPTTIVFNLTKEFFKQIETVFYNKQTLSVFFKRTSIDVEFARLFAGRVYELFTDILTFTLRFIEEQTHSITSSSSACLTDYLLSMILDQFIVQLSYAFMYDCDFLTSLIFRLLTFPQLNLLLSESSYFEMLVRQTKSMSIETQEKLNRLINMVSQSNPSFVEFVQLNLSKNIRDISCVRTSFEQPQSAVEKVMSSPLCLNLSQGISEKVSAEMINQGYGYSVIENMCEYVMMSNGRDLVDQLNVIENLFVIVMNVIQGRLNNSTLFFVQQGELIEDLLLGCLSFSEVAVTTSVKNADISDLVKWTTANIDVILARLKCSSWISTILTVFISQNSRTLPSVCFQYLQEVRSIHNVRRDRQMKGCSQLDVDLSLTSYFCHILLSSMDGIAQSDNLFQSLCKSLLCVDEVERFSIVKAFTSLLFNCVFMNDLFVSMLQSTVFNHHKLSLQKYDDILLSLQFAVVLGGAKTLVDSLVLRWMKDAASYKDFNVYMTSDLHFLMQILEDDMCYVNVSGLYKGLLKNSEEEGKYDRQIRRKVKKYIVNYLHICGPLDKDTVKAKVRSQMSSEIIDSDSFFQCCLEEVSQLGKESTTSRYELQDVFLNKCFASLFNRDQLLLNKLLDQTQGDRNDLFRELQIDNEDQPFRYLQDVRRCLLGNVDFHRHFREVFLENNVIFQENTRVVCRITHYILDVLEESLENCRSTKTISSDSTKSLLVLYIFDPLLTNQISHILNLINNTNSQSPAQLIFSLQNVSLRCEQIKNLIQNIFTGSNISDIIL